MPHERAGVLSADTRTHAHTCVCKRLELLPEENQKPVTKNRGRGSLPTVCPFIASEFCANTCTWSTFFKKCFSWPHDPGPITLSAPSCSFIKETS